MTQSRRAAGPLCRGEGPAEPPGRERTSSLSGGVSLPGRGDQRRCPGGVSSHDEERSNRARWFRAPWFPGAPGRRQRRRAGRHGPDPRLAARHSAGGGGLARGSPGRSHRAGPRPARAGRGPHGRGAPAEPRQQRRRGQRAALRRQLHQGAAPRSARARRAGGLPAAPRRAGLAAERRIRGHPARSREAAADQPPGGALVRLGGARPAAVLAAAGAGLRQRRDGRRDGRALLDGGPARRQLPALRPPPARARRRGRPQPALGLPRTAPERPGDAAHAVPRRPARQPERPLRLAVHVARHALRGRDDLAPHAQPAAVQRPPDELRPVAGGAERAGAGQRPVRPRAPLHPQRPRPGPVGARRRAVPGLLQRLPDPGHAPPRGAESAAP